MNLFTIFAIFSIGKLGSSQNVVPQNSRIDCFPDRDPNQSGCVSRGCIWNDTDTGNNAPLCFYPSNTGYVVNSVENSTNTITLTNFSKNPFGDNFGTLNFTWTEIGNGIRINIAPNGAQRYRPPVPINSNPNISSTAKLRVVTDNNTIFNFYVQRVSTGANIWNTSIGGLMFSDKFLQIATYLPTDKIYGFGENVHPTLKHNFTYYNSWGMFARDQPPNSISLYNQQNLYGAHPFYLGLEPDGSAHGVFIFNSNAQDYTIGPAPHLIYRTIGGFFEIYFFPGPTPEEVIRQYQEVIGQPFLPAYWALGFQLCRWGYKNLTALQTVINRTLSNGIPLDVVWTDIDYMYDHRDFSLDPVNWTGLGNYTNSLHAQGMKLTQIFDPAIEVDYYSFERAVQNYSASFVEWPNDTLVPQEVQNQYPLTAGTKIMLGAVWPDRNVAFPDFLDPRNSSSGQSPTFEWWAQEFKIYHDTLVPFDGIWIDMNEPSNFATRIYYMNSTLPSTPGTKPSADPLRCPDNDGYYSLWEVPAYQTTAVYVWGNNSFLCSNTLCMCGTTSNGTQIFYNTKNLYGWSETRATNYALRVATGKRGQTISRSTFPSSGRYGGHWTGDNTARWEDLRTAVIEIQEFNLFGIPFVGSDICGFAGNANSELCARWQQLGAFHSFSRNHNSISSIPQDPGLWPLTAQAARKANLFRYRHLPYLFSLHFHTSLRGGTVVRTVFFEFPTDSNTFDLSYQFMWGGALMIVPVIYEGYLTVSGYLPSGSTWYSMYDYMYGTQIAPGFQNFTAPLEYLIPVFVRGGHILPRQRPGMTTVASRTNEFQLLVASELLPSGLYARGEFYWDDGETIVDDFSVHNYYQFTFIFSADSTTANGGSLNITRERQATNLPLPTLDNIEILGYSYQPDFTTFQLNGVGITIQTPTYEPTTQILNITSRGLIDWTNNGPSWILTWKNANSIVTTVNNISSTIPTGALPTTTQKSSRLVFSPLIILSALLFCFCLKE